MRLRLRTLVIAPIIAIVACFSLVAGASAAFHVWSAPTLAGDGTQDGPRAVEVAANGDALIVSGTIGGLRSQIRRGGVWSPMSVIPTAATSIGLVAASSDPDGRLYATWSAWSSVTSKRTVEVAVSQPGSTAWEGPYQMFGAEFDQVGGPSIAADGAGNVTIASMNSSDGGSTHDLYAVRCNFTGAPQCEATSVVPGGDNRMPVALSPAAGLSAVASITAAGDVNIQEWTSLGLGTPITVGSITPGASGVAGWAGNGKIVLEFLVGSDWSTVTFDGSVWTAPLPQTGYLTDAAFDASGMIYEIYVDSAGVLWIQTTPDGVLFDDVHQLSSSSIDALNPPSVAVAADGTVVVVWGTAATHAVDSALRVDGAWQSMPSIGTFANCGGEPMMAASTAGGALAVWESDISPYAMYLSEMALVVDPTTTTTAGDLTPNFAC